MAIRGGEGINPITDAMFGVTGGADAANEGEDRSGAALGVDIAKMMSSVPIGRLVDFSAGCYRAVSAGHPRSGQRHRPGSRHRWSAAPSSVTSFRRMTLVLRRAIRHIPDV